ncbi:hypothetical protein [Mesorhizobium sp. CAU 1741]|uniref:hypothetical protein n=1 Tax=Mesorhizobium sp. CAU 1741 TaxID=3140366 RepID=UPI00325B4FCE
MSVGLIGALIGLVVAILDFAFLRLLASRVDLADTKRALNVAGVAQLVLLPVMGWFLGPVIAGE